MTDHTYAVVMVEANTEGKDELVPETVDNDMAVHREGSRTDTDTVVREAEAIKLDGLSVADVKLLRDSAEKHAFQAEVNRMMKLITNSLYENKDVFLRELISNASDALDKIRLLSLTDKSILDATEELTIKIKADKENKVLHITDTGIGMTKEDLIKNLGTITKSGTTEFLGKLQDAASASEMSDLIDQFGVGFYSAFLVADKVVVTSKNNDGIQHIWESDVKSFSVAEDPRGPTLKRGTQISLYLKEEAHDFLEQDTVRELIKKYSQFINFYIYLWGSSTQTVEEPIGDDEEEEEENKEDGEEGTVEEDNEKEKKPKTKKVEKTTWDWELCNSAKQIPDDKYLEFWKEHSTNGKLGVIEDTADRTRLAKLLRFTSSSGNLTSLAEYVERMKDKQESIYYIAGGSKEEVSSSPFVERLLKKGYEVLFLTEAVDEYAISSLPEFEGKKFQNVAKEGFNLDGDTEAAKERREAVKEKFDSLTKWLGEDALKDHILRAEVSERLVDSPCALITSK